jgi:hypothetical protein
VIDGLKLLGHDLILHPELRNLLILFNIHLSAGLLPAPTSLRLCIIIVFEYFRLIIDSPEYLIFFLQLRELLPLILFDVLKVINRILIHQRIFIRLNKFIILIFIFFIVFFFLLATFLSLFEGVRGQELCLVLRALMLQLAGAVGDGGLIDEGQLAVVVGCADLASDLVVDEPLGYLALG